MDLPPPQTPYTQIHIFGPKRDDCVDCMKSMAFAPSLCSLYSPSQIVSHFLEGRAAL